MKTARVVRAVLVLRNVMAARNVVVDAMVEVGTNAALNHAALNHAARSHAGQTTGIVRRALNAGDDRSASLARNVSHESP